MRRFLRILGAALLVGGAFFLSAGCAGRPLTLASVEGPTFFIPGVPFLQQEDETCGPSALAMVLRFHGGKQTTRELAPETRTEALRGALITDLATAARRRGYKAEIVDLDLPRLKATIKEGMPVILLVDEGFLAYSVPHYLVAFGYTEDGFVVHTGKTPESVIAARKLDSRWEKMGRLALVVSPGGKRK
jgi:ABC-type bacteriocin/lantibiotic exporter with double-glycine peptidase domain